MARAILSNLSEGFKGLNTAKITSWSSLHQATEWFAPFCLNTPINRILVVWNHQEPPLPAISFDFLPCSPPCEVRNLKMTSRDKCWGIGHISRYCSALSKCAWCAARHDSRTCPEKKPTSLSKSSSSSDPSPEMDKSRWKCPRCHKPGVNVWHGCARRQPPLPPPPPPPSPSTQSWNAGAVPALPSRQELAIRKSVEFLMARCSALEKSFDALDARFESLLSAHVATDNRLSSLVDTNQAVIASVTALTDKMDANRFDRMCDLSTRPSTSSPASAKTRITKHRVR